jgi:hypothetical protein
VLQARTRPAIDPVVRSLQEQCLTMLEDLSFQRHSGDWEEPILAGALQWARDRDLHCAPSMVDRWERVVHDVLCETGLVVPTVDGLEFSHVTFEDFLAARYMYRRLSQRAGEQQLTQSLSELLEEVSSSYDSSDDFFYYSDSFRFLVGMWAAGKHDSDWFTAEILDATPAASSLVVGLMADGIPLGEKVTAALERIGGDWRETDDHRIDSAKALAALDMGRGVALLLALTVDHDVDGFDRLKITHSLARSFPPVAGAIMWLTFTEYWDSPDMRYKTEAISQVTGLLLDESTVLQGLKIIAANPHLDHRYRVSAAVDIAKVDSGTSQGLLKSLMPVRALALHLADAAEHGNDAALSSLWCLTCDKSLAVADRFDAAGALASVNDDAGTEAFQELSSDQTACTVRLGGSACQSRRPAPGCLSPSRDAVCTKPSARTASGSTQSPRSPRPSACTAPPSMTTSRRKPDMAAGPPDASRRAGQVPGARNIVIDAETAPKLASGRWLTALLGEHALAVGDAEEEPEPGEVVAHRVGVVGLAADEPGQGRGEGGAVGFQPVVEELEHFGEFDGVGHVQGNGWHYVVSCLPVSRGAGPTVGWGTG